MLNFLTGVGNDKTTTTLDRHQDSECSYEHGLPFNFAHRGNQGQRRDPGLKSFCPNPMWALHFIVPNNTLRPSRSYKFSSPEFESHFDSFGIDNHFFLP